MVAWFALIISLASLAILVWDKFLRQAKFDVKGDWILSASQPALRFVVFNVGYRKGTVRDIRLRQHDMPIGRGWTPYQRVMSKLPIVLDGDEARRRSSCSPRIRRATSSIWRSGMGGSTQSRSRTLAGISASSSCPSSIALSTTR